MTQFLPLLFVLTLPLLTSSSPPPCDHDKSQSAIPPPFSFVFGGSQATVISDGSLVFPTLPYTNIPDDAVRRAYAENFQPSRPVLLSQNILIIDLPAGRVMLDTGSFNIPGNSPRFSSAGRMFESLKLAGIEPESIEYIMLSHAHIDHVGGLTNRDGSAAFPNATVFINKRDHEFWTADVLNITNPSTPIDFANLVQQVYLNRIVPYQANNRLKLLEDFESPIEGVRFVPTNGHSPGHSAIEVTSGGERLLYIGDAWVTKADQVQNPEWPLFIETDSQTAFESRLRLLRDGTRTRDLILAYHEPFPGLGFVKRFGSSFDWTPASRQKLVADENRRLRRLQN